MNEAAQNQGAEGAEGSDEGSDSGSTLDPQLETKAREMGWVPKTEFRGDQTKWIDAAPYVAHGETVLPIVRANNRRLQTEVQGLRSELNQRTAAEAELRESIEDLKKFNTEIQKDRVKTTRASVAAGIKQAREDGDIERELELRDQLDEANAALKESEAEAKPQARQQNQSQNPQQAPEFQAWQTANPWFGQDARKTNYALAVAKDLRTTHVHLVGTPAFFTEVSKEVDAVFSPQQRRGASKVEGGTGSINPGGGGSRDEGGKTFADLPAEAQAKAREQSKRFVGANKGFKTEAEWLKHFTIKYFE